MAVLLPFHGGPTMPEFTTVLVQEAQLRTIPGRQGQFINEYADYIQQLPQGQAGKLSIGEDEKHTAIRHRLATTAKAMNINLIIKRSGNDLYFWREDGGEEQASTKRKYTRRMREEAELPPPDQPIDELGMTEQGIPGEASPELGQTDQVVEDAARRVDPE
jgi:hypothetical protein